MIRRRFQHAIGLNIGRVLSRSVAIWGRNFVAFTILALLIQAPLVAYAISADVRTASDMLIYGIVLRILPSILSLVTAGAVAYGVFRQLNGETASIGRCLSMGLSRLGRVLGVAAAIGVIAAIFLTGLFLAIAYSLAGGLNMVYLLVSGFLLIPVCMILCTYWVAIPAAVVEGTGVFRALRRSAFLTREARLAIFGVVMILGLLSTGAGILAQFVTPALDHRPLPEPPEFRYDPEAGEEASNDRYLAEYHDYYTAIAAAEIDAARPKSVTMLITSAILACLSAVAAVVVYHDLRVQKEQVGVDKILEVFA